MMTTRRKIAIGAASLAAAAAVTYPATRSSQGGSIDVLVGSTPTPSPTATATPTPTPTPDPGSANVWVNTSAGGTPSRCSSPCAYDSGDAYGSLDAAWDAATAGDTIGVNASSSYGAQTITGNKASETTVLANGSTFDAIDAEGNNLTMVDFDVDGANADAAADDVTFRDLRILGLGTDMLITGDRFEWDGGQFGFAGWNPEDRTFCGGGTSPEPLEIKGAVDPVFRDIHFYHVERLNDPTNTCDHLEYVRIDLGGSGAWFDRVMFDDEGGLEESNTATMLITNPSNGTTYSGLKITNSYFGDNQAQSGVISPHEHIDACPGWLIAYNTFRTIAYVPSTADATVCTGNLTGTVWVGNLGPYTSFHPCHGTHLKNRWQHSVAGSCGTDAWTTGPDYGVGNLGFSTTTGLLTTGSVALDAAETSYCASAIGNLDAFGRARTGTCSNGWAEVVG